MRLGAVLALSAGVVLAGCGGATQRRPLSAAEYRREASRLCIQWQSIVVPDRGTATTKKQLRAIDDARVRDGRAHRAQLGALVPPVFLAALARRWVAALAAESAALDTYLGASDGRLPKRLMQLNVLERLGDKAQRLAARLGATGCALPAMGEGYRPYPLHEVEAALRAEGLRYSDPFLHGSTYATGWTACALTGRPLFANGWALTLFQNEGQADATAACLGKTNRRGRDFLARGNVVVSVRYLSLLPRLRRALSLLH